MKLFIYFVIVYGHFVSTEPNFVFVLTDDQDLLLDGMVPMKNTLNLVANNGKTFTNARVNSPICCPSRSTILTGKYAHSIKVFNNSIEGNCSSLPWQQTFEPVSIAAYLKNYKEYVTFYAGKYLNKYGSKNAGGLKHVPYGYDWWIGLQGNSKYYNYTLSVNGTKKSNNRKYLTDALAKYSLNFLDNRPENSPFFMMIGTPAPHAPFTPAKRHINEYDGVKAIRTPSFNYSSQNKHWIVQMKPEYLPDNITILDKIQQHRLESLLAVDELVKKIVSKLKSLNLWDNTYVIYTSDNGFHIGNTGCPSETKEDNLKPFGVKRTKLVDYYTNGDVFSSFPQMSYVAIKEFK